jgi:hypothetical protein
LEKRAACQQRFGGSPVESASGIVKRVDRRTQWRGQPDTSRWRLVRVLLLSALLHLPLTPLAALAGLLGLLFRPAPVDLPELPPIQAIPVDLLEEEAEATKESEPEPVAEVAPAPPPEPERAPEAPRTPEPKEPEKEATKPAEEADKREPPKGGIGDPVALSGSAGSLADSNANVRLLIFTDRMRNHPLGNRIGELLAAADQWKDFFGPGGLDPVRDVDRILIAGPQLRDSSQVLAVLRTSATPERVRSTVDVLVKRDPEGKWLDAAVPAAKARADRAERIFVLPKPGLVIVTPPSAAEDAIKRGKSLRFPDAKGSEVLTTYVVTPWRAFIGVPFEVPKSIAWVKMKITATADGGATAELEAEDESEELAKKNAEKLAAGINRVTQIQTGALGAMFGVKAFKLIEPVSFSASGKKITGTVVATPSQLGALLEAVSKLAKEIAAENAKKAKAAAQADAGAQADAAAGAPADAAAPTPPAEANAAAGDE